MIPGPTVVYACPVCHAFVTKPTLRSGNTASARFWTDGKMEAPMLPRFPQIAHCQTCRTYYWLEDDRCVGSYGDRSDRATTRESKTLDEWLRAPEVHWLSKRELLEAIASPAGKSMEEERALRVELWWLTNDRFRHDPPQEGSVKRLRWLRKGKENAKDVSTQVEPKLELWERENLERLFELLDVKHPNERLMKAELARELGQFADSLALVAEPFPVNMQRAVSLIRRLAEQGKTAVAEIIAQ